MPCFAKKMKGAPVFCESLSALASLLPSGSGKCLLVCDTNTQAHCLPLLLPFLPGAYHVYATAPGESSKSLNTCTELWEEMHKYRMEKTDYVLALGGGVVTDLAGFCASLYKRGIPCIFIPTTVMGMCDAGIGGKTGIDFRGTKNTLGTFYLPESVLIWPGFAQTLSKREINNGFAEILKACMLQGKNPGDFQNPDLTLSQLPRLIRECADFKWQVVQDDFTDAGRRQVLNFGHSLGHAIESCSLVSENPLLHGEAIAAGMVMEAFLSCEKFGWGQAWLQEVLLTIDVYFPRIRLPEEAVLFDYLYHDKKNMSGQLRMSLMQAPGQCATGLEVSRDEVRKALHFYLNNLPLH